MDYQRIYGEFIADRIARPPAHSEYVEVHHILPRCMGGTDDPGNLIRLRPEDHFFAHVLLAKGHEMFALWSAVIVMHGRGKRPTIFRRKSRLTYGWARRRYSRLCTDIRRGQSNPNHNPETLTLRSPDGSLISASRSEFAARFGLLHSELCGLLTRRRKSARGWMLPETDAGFTGKAAGSLSKRDPKVYQWRHLDGRQVSCTRFELCQMYGLRSGDVSSVVSGKHSNCYGWHLDDGRTVGWSNGRRSFRDDATYTLINADGSKATGVRKGLAVICGAPISDISSVITGARKSSNGWMLPDTYESGHRPKWHISPKRKGLETNLPSASDTPKISSKAA